MTNPRSISDVIKQISTPERLKNQVPQLPAPSYDTGSYCNRARVAFAVESMKDHTSDEGWQLMLALKHAGYSLCGHHLQHGINTDVILKETNPAVVVVQDKREWDKISKDFREIKAHFDNIRSLRKHDSFKLTILKDAHQKPTYHSASAHEMGVHAWIVYYHPRIVNHLSSFTRPQHLIRTYHSIDSSLVPEFNHERRRCLLSGAVSSVYPFRQRLIEAAQSLLLPETDYLKHPGYHRRGTATPKFLTLLNRYKVSICTSSIFGYSLRKIIESIACGCIVITDLPHDDFLPGIDRGLVRVGNDTTVEEICDMLPKLYKEYDYNNQIMLASIAKNYYDYHAIGLRLHDDIETMRKSYVISSSNTIPQSVR